METDDLTPEGGEGFDDTVAAAGEPEATPDRSPSQQRLKDEVKGRLFEGRPPRRSLEPGTLVAGRYRIVELLGAGGMGEVFRARDLVLDEDVAVKFLPESRAHDEGFMRRFINEVRLARQISHPSVCRVHDIGEVDGRSFLSMEYIDGEDLASLLRRIGRLPPEKGYELAQQLCAGLAELHEAGLLHRDLKPANLMIDGQGRLKLADFGLAAVREELRAHEYGDGTPAYMAPEQLSGREVSQRSDIYALGVVLYELLSGRHPHEAADGQTGARGAIDRTAPAVSLGARVTGLADDTLEIIDRCLQDDPKLRPGSVLDVAAALPGGDPIAAALRAGRAPSVDAIANAASTEQLVPWQAWVLAAFSVAFLLFYASVGSSLTVWGKSSPQLAPAVLEDRAREVLDALGVDHPAGGTMHRFVRDPSYRRSPPPRMELLEGRPVPVLYEYRASPSRLVRLGATESDDDPPMTTPGEVRVVLDVHGLLRTFERVPVRSDGVPTDDVDWGPAFERAAVVRRESGTPSDVPPHAIDSHRAWSAWISDLPEPVEVEAATWRGQPVWFHVDPPWAPEAAASAKRSTGSPLVEQIILLFFFSTLVLLARRSYRRGEVDARGAIRVSLVLALGVSVSEYLTAAVGLASPQATVVGVAQEGLVVGLISLLGYAIVEPYGRRFLPGVMASWIRLTRGQWRDPLVGRDVLFGAAVGCLIGGLAVVRVQYTAEEPLMHVRLDGLIGLGHALGAVIGALWLAAFGVMQIYVLFLALRWVVRRNSLAVAGFLVLWGTMEISSVLQDGDLSTQGLVVGVVTSLSVASLLAYVIVRRGLLVLSVAQVMLNLILTLPLTLDFSGWYGTASAASIGTVVLIVFGALHVAMGRARPVDRTSRTSRTRA